MTGIVLFAHGSTVESANDAVHAVTAELARRTGEWVETAFLDCVPPRLADAVGTLVTKGATRIVVIPYFLTLGIHLQRDLPRIADELRRIYEGVDIDVTEPLDGHPALLEILVDRWKKAHTRRG
jgi:sirohydrochlorin ferrochelatase